jgi:uncharacterized protein (TIGR02466 family)
MNTIGLFPVAVGMDSIERYFTKKEMSTFDKIMETTHNNEGNITTDNNYVLDTPALKKLKELVKTKLDLFIDTHYPPENEDLKFVITQSWINISQPNQWHHPHGHPNSLFSGVLYLNAVPDVDKIFFIKDEPYQRIEYPFKGWNSFNSREWWLPVETGSIVIFPSYLRHRVAPNQSEHNRVSLSFNTFAIGKLGREENLTGLDTTTLSL